MARYKKMTAEKLAKAVGLELLNYRAHVVDKAIMQETGDAMHNLVQKTKATAPVGKRSDHYRDSIDSRVLHSGRTKDGTAYFEQWYVRGSDYRLSHLLNNGHALRDGGRYEGTNFIGKAYQEVQTDFIKAIEEAIRKGEIRKVN